MNDNETNILYYPVQMKGFDEPVTEYEFVYRARISLTQFLNLWAMGKVTMTPSMAMHLKHTNQTFQEMGYDPINYDLFELH